jgi:hypothetical protein
MDPFDAIATAADRIARENGSPARTVALMERPNSLIAPPTGAGLREVIESRIERLGIDLRQPLEKVTLTRLATEAGTTERKARGIRLTGGRKPRSDRGIPRASKPHAVTLKPELPATSSVEVQARQLALVIAASLHQTAPDDRETLLIAAGLVSRVLG